MGIRIQFTFHLSDEPSIYGNLLVLDWKDTRWRPPWYLRVSDWSFQEVSNHEARLSLRGLDVNLSSGYLKEGNWSRDFIVILTMLQVARKLHMLGKCMQVAAILLLQLITKLSHCIRPHAHIKPRETVHHSHQPQTCFCRPSWTPMFYVEW